MRVAVLADVESGKSAVAPARGDDRNLARERHDAFQDARRVAKTAEDRVHVATAADHGLALAVIAHASGLQDRRVAHRGYGGRHRSGVVDGPIGGRRDTDGIEKILFDQPVLRQFQRARAGHDGTAGGQKGSGCSRNILEFIGYERDRIGESREFRRFGIAPQRMGCGHVEGRAIALWRIDMAFQAKTRCGQRQHPAKLSTAQNADRIAGVQRRGVHARSLVSLWVSS